MIILRAWIGMDGKIPEMCWISRGMVSVFFTLHGCQTTAYLYTTKADDAAATNTGAVYKLNK